MAIDNKDKIKAGVKLVARYKGAIVECIVGEKDGALTYTVGDQTFNSPSKAGSHAANGTSVNGYRFWSLEGELGEGRKATEPKAPKAKGEKAAPKAKAEKAPKAANPVIKKQRKQPEGLAEGEVSYFCSACMKPFTAPTSPAPTACPEGHTEAVATAPETEAEAPAAETATEDAPAEEPVPLDI